MGSSQYEKDWARQMGGRMQPASGALWFAKSDVIVGRWLAEIKETDADLFRVPHKLWKLTWDRAVQASYLAAMGIRVRHMEFCVLDANDWRAMGLTVGGSLGKKQTIRFEEALLDAMQDNALHCDLYKLGMRDYPVVIVPKPMFKRVIDNGLAEEI